SVLYLGDAVGYNADPNDCVTRILDMADAVIRGNHDKTVASADNLEWFNEVAREAILWTRDTLVPENLRRLGEIPAGPLEVLERYLICHGSPMDEDLYITRQRDVQKSFDFMRRRFPKARICFFGHTHVPLLIEEGGEAVAPAAQNVLRPDRRYLINPGSVGQPRDRDPRAAFGILESGDDGEAVFRQYRVEYPLERTQAKIRAAGLPAMLAERLELGW
ncbi:MAG: metallophosphoesterase family protein, partial [Spirochaetales bacterium]|nr:metallophosphoesterase family protein [Spirochaetales bacterium]